MPKGNYNILPLIEQFTKFYNEDTARKAEIKKNEAGLEIDRKTQGLSNVNTAEDLNKQLATSLSYANATGNQDKIQGILQTGQFIGNNIEAERKRKYAQGDFNSQFDDNAKVFWKGKFVTGKDAKDDAIKDSQGDIELANALIKKGNIAKSEYTVARVIDPNKPGSYKYSVMKVYKGNNGEIEYDSTFEPIKATGSFNGGWKLDKEQNLDPEASKAIEAMYQDDLKSDLATKHLSLAYSQSVKPTSESILQADYTISNKKLDEVNGNNWTEAKKRRGITTEAQFNALPPEEKESIRQEVAAANEEVFGKRKRVLNDGSIVFTKNVVAQRDYTGNYKLKIAGETIIPMQTNEKYTAVSGNEGYGYTEQKASKPKTYSPNQVYQERQTMNSKLLAGLNSIGKFQDNNGNYKNLISEPKNFFSQKKIIDKMYENIKEFEPIEAGIIKELKLESDKVAKLETGTIIDPKDMGNNSGNTIFDGIIKNENLFKK